MKLLSYLHESKMTYLKIYIKLHSRRRKTFTFKTRKKYSCFYFPFNGNTSVNFSSIFIFIPISWPHPASFSPSLHIDLCGVSLFRVPDFIKQLCMFYQYNKIRSNILIRIATAQPKKKKIWYFFSHFILFCILSICIMGQNKINTVQSRLV